MLEIFIFLYFATINTIAQILKIFLSLNKSFTFDCSYFSTEFFANIPLK